MDQLDVAFGDRRFARFQNRLGAQGGTMHHYVVRSRQKDFGICGFWVVTLGS
jgi:hypothetical protein